MKRPTDSELVDGRFYLGGVVCIGNYFTIGSKDYGVTSFQDLSPYNKETSFTIEPWPYRYENGTGHNGVDLATPVGTPIIAQRDLKIQKIGSDSTSGNYFFATISGKEFFFCHLQDIPSKTSFKKGEIVAFTGDTGGVAPHLHVDCRKIDQYVFYNVFEQTEFALLGETPAPTPPPVTPPPTSGKTTFSKYYANGWINETVSLNNSSFINETNTSKYGTGAVILTKAEAGFLVETRFSGKTGGSTTPPPTKKLTQYYYNGVWTTDTTLTLKTDSKSLKKETDTAKYGNNAYELIEDADGFKKGTVLR